MSQGDTTGVGNSGRLQFIVYWTGGIQSGSSRNREFELREDQDGYTERCPVSEHGSFHGGSARFPTTHWSRLQAAFREPAIPEYHEILNDLISRYWKPVYLFIYRSGYAEQHRGPDAGVLSPRASEGTVREGGSGTRQISDIPTRLPEELLDRCSSAPAAMRIAARGHLKSEKLASKERGPIEPIEAETPEGLYYRAWVTELLNRVWTCSRRNSQQPVRRCTPSCSAHGCSSRSWPRRIRRRCVSWPGSLAFPEAGLQLPRNGPSLPADPA